MSNADTVQLAGFVAVALVLAAAAVLVYAIRKGLYELSKLEDSAADPHPSGRHPLDPPAGPVTYQSSAAYEREQRRDQRAGRRATRAENRAIRRAHRDLRGR